MLNFCRQLRLLHGLLLVLMLLHLGPHGAVACMRADGSRSYGAACSCKECKDAPAEDSCSCGSDAPCQNAANESACHSVSEEGRGHGLSSQAAHACCIDHSLSYGTTHADKLPQRAVAELVAVCIPAAVFAVESRPLIQVQPRSKAPPGRLSPAVPGILPLRI